MRKILCFVAGAIGLGCFLYSGTYSMSYAAPPAPSAKHEIVVSADGDGDYTTISSALAVITNASVTNRYVLRIKPGTYNCSSLDSLQPGKEWISIIGSGRDNTILSGRITGFKGSTIADLTINSPNNGSSGNVLFCSVNGGGDTVTINNVDIIASDPVGYPAIQCNTDLLINNSRLVTNSAGIGFDYGTAVINNMEVHAATDGIKISAHPQGSYVTIKNSKISSDGIAVNLQAYSDTLSRIGIHNSDMEGTSALYLSPESSSSNVINVSSSRVAGTYNLRPGIDKIVNSFDSNYGPVPNQ